MALLQRSDITLHIAPQAVYDTINANPVFTEVRKTGGGLVSNPTYVQGNELKTNGQAAKQIQTLRESSMSIEFDMNQQTAGLFENLIYGTQEDNSQSADTGIEATATGFIMPPGHVTALSVGDWFKLEGFANSELDVVYKVASIDSATEITTSVAPDVTEAAGASVTLTSIKCASGTTQTVITAQQRTYDGSKVGNIDYMTAKNVISDSGSISIGKSGIVTGSFEYNLGKPETSRAAITGQTDAAKDTSDVVSADNNTKMLFVDGVNAGCLLSSMDVEFANNHEGDGGGAGGCPQEYGRGQVSVSGALVAKTFRDESMTWHDRQQNGTRIALASHVYWPDGRWMVIEVTRAVVTEHSFDGDSFVENTMSYTAEGDPATGATVQIFRSWT